MSEKQKEEKPPNRIKRAQKRGFSRGPGGEKIMLPKDVKLSSVFRAVEWGMATGYMWAALDASNVRVEPTHKLELVTERVRKIFSPDEPLHLDLNVYVQVIQEHLKEIQGVFRWDMVEFCVYDAHSRALNRRGRRTLEEANKEVTKEALKKRNQRHKRRSRREGTK